jgi:peptidoglycan biosynthesis protein MviN/MurJ (putative lipid II flippase)
MSALSVLSPILVWALAPTGLIGAATGVALATMLRSGVGLWALQRLPERAMLDGRGVIRLLGALTAATAVGLAAQYRWHWPWVAMIFIGTYLLGTLWARPLAGQEFELIQRALGSRFAWLGRLTQRTRQPS